MKKIKTNCLLSVLAIFLVVFISCKKDNDKTEFVETTTFDTVRIGNQTWMAENLKLTHDVNGNYIPYVADDNDWANLENNNSRAAWCYYNNDPTQGNGVLYTYAAALKVCPKGWHLPSHEEWIQMEDLIEAENFNITVGDALKATSGWANYGVENNEDGNGLDLYGFHALPGGIRYSGIGEFDELETSVHWWTRTEIDEKMAYSRSINSGSGLMYGNMLKSAGFCVRCVKDSM